MIIKSIESCYMYNVYTVLGLLLISWILEFASRFFVRN